MDYNRFVSELERLDFEDFLWIVFAILCLLNYSGDNNDKAYIRTNDYYYKRSSNTIFELTVIVTFIIYVYFLVRNYKFYAKASEEEKSLYFVKVLGSCFLIAGSICLIYFQTVMFINDNKKEYT